MKLKKILLLTVPVATAAWLLFFLEHKKLNQVSRPVSQPLTVAVFDTGSGEADETGHGTKVVALISSKIKNTRVLSYKISKNGFSTSPQEFIGAVEKALQDGAKILHFSFGLGTGGNDAHLLQELTQVLNKAHAQGKIIVAATGVGIENPFKSVAIEDVFPAQSPFAITVGTALEADEALHPNRAENFGSSIDLVVKSGGPFITDDPKSTGSSFAAAVVTGEIAKQLETLSFEEREKIDPEQLRMQLRHTSDPLPYYWLTDARDSKEPRGGFGVFNPGRFEQAGNHSPDSLGKTECRLAQSSNSPPNAVLQLNSAVTLQSIVNLTSNAGPCANSHVTIDSNKLALAKGLARVRIENFVFACDYSLRLNGEQVLNLKSCGI